ncbi:MAG: hypothetical protein O9246_00155 [Brevundimonas sp.]|nr:hypothetical protein [Brevundimonas sp.]
MSCELERRLPATDPLDRQITIGFGAFLELLRMAASKLGYEALITEFPQGEPGNRLDERPIANVIFRKNPLIKADPLFQHVLARRTNRGPFDMTRAVDEGVLASVRSASLAPGQVFSSSEPKLTAKLRDLVWAAFKMEAMTHDPHMESVNLMRLGRAEVTANPDGISLDAPELEALVVQGILTRGAMASPDTPVFKQFLAVTEAPVRATPAFVWLVTPDNRRVSQLAAGRDWVRLNLMATSMGLGLHPQSATLQEYPEMYQLLDEVHDLLDARKGRIQMLGRIGYAPRAVPSPRWPLETRLRT